MHVHINSPIVVGNKLCVCVCVHAHAPKMHHIVCNVVRFLCLSCTYVRTCVLQVYSTRVCTYAFTPAYVRTVYMYIRMCACGYICTQAHIID